MASFSAGTTFTDGVANDVTAAKLGALVNNATPLSGLIQDRTAETITATNDTLLIGDASDSNALKRITVANFAQTLPTAKITTGTIETGTFGTTTSTAATITTGTITTGVIPTLTAGTTTSTAATITTGTIPTLVATTLITSGTGTAAAPAIVPTGDTNTGAFFPAAATVGISTGGAERVRVDSSGNVGINTSSPDALLDVKRTNSDGLIAEIGSGDLAGDVVLEIKSADSRASINIGANGGTGDASRNLVFSTAGTERLRIDSSGNVGIGTASVASTATSGFAFLPSSTSYAYINGVNGTGSIWLGNNNDGSNASNGVNCGSISFRARHNGVYGGGSDVASIYGTYTGNGTTRSGAIRFITVDSGSEAERLRIDSSGNVGIGTTSPHSPATASPSLDIAGGVNKTANIFLHGNNTSGGSGGLQIQSGSDASAYIYNNSNAPLVFATNSTERLRIDSSGNVLVTNAAGLGYGTGAGGTVTQGTNKATGVTLNKPTGQITTSTATLNANTTVSFVLTNSIIASTDTISINHTSGGTGSSYLVWASGISAGSASINLRNITAGNLSDSLVLNFNVIKGVTS